MVPVRKPGRPLSCPHPRGSTCSCPGRSPSTIAIPRGRKCECWGMARTLLTPTPSAAASPSQSRRALALRRRRSDADPIQETASGTGLSFHDMLFDTGQPAEEADGMIRLGTPQPDSREMPPTAWNLSFRRPSASSVEDFLEEQGHFSPMVHGRSMPTGGLAAAPVPMPMPPLVVHQPAVRNSRGSLSSSGRNWKQRQLRSCSRFTCLCSTPPSR